MDRRKLIAAFGLTICAYLAVKMQKKRQTRRFKIRPTNRQRSEKGPFHHYTKMKSLNPDQFFQCTRMTPAVFEKLHQKVASLIKKQRRTDGISSQDRLVITLQYLSQGRNMQVLAQNFQVGHTTVHKIVHETCQAICEVLSPEYLKSPSTKAEWLQIAEEFQLRCNFPHCVGALAGKYINVQTNSSSKNNSGILLLAACDSKYRFILVDVKAYSSQSEGELFRQSIFGQSLEDANLNLPDHSELPGSNMKMPYFFVAGETFPLKPFIMRPYPIKDLTNNQTTFNNQLSHAHQAIENTIGILVARWRILKTITAKVENIDKIVKAVIVLHNFCLKEMDHERHNMYCPPEFTDSPAMENGHWRNEVMPLKSVGRLGANRGCVALNNFRDVLADYIVSNMLESEVIEETVVS